MPDPAVMFTIDDWSWSTFPAPQLGVAPTQPDDAYVVIGMAGGPDRQARRLTPAQAIELADELRARASVISPSLAGAAAPQPPASSARCGVWLRLPDNLGSAPCGCGDPEHLTRWRAERDRAPQPPNHEETQ